MDDTAAETGGAEAAELPAALAPRDALEAMLTAQMAAAHEAALRAMERAAECAEHPQIEALYLRQATRLLHLFVRQTEALDRRPERPGGRRNGRGNGSHPLNGAGPS